MTTAHQTAAKPKPRGFGALPCILCGQETTISLDLDEVDNFHCSECDGVFSVSDLRDHMERWQKVLAWIHLAPDRGENS
jgi:hypothetical protein